MEVTHVERPSQDRPEPVSAGIPQMNRHFWPNCNQRDRFEQSSRAGRPELP